MGRRLLQVGEQKRSWSCVYFPWLNGSDSLPGQPWTKPVSCLEHWAAKLGSGGGGQDKGPYSAGFPALLSLFANASWRCTPHRPCREGHTQEVSMVQRGVSAAVAGVGWPGVLCSVWRDLGFLPRP